MEEKYNGWTNYQTWRINLELIDGYMVEECITDYIDLEEYQEVEEEEKRELKEKAIYQLSEHLEWYVTEILELDNNNETTLSYAMAFINPVNWYEIAESYIKDYIAEYK